MGAAVSPDSVPCGPARLVLGTVVLAMVSFSACGDPLEPFDEAELFSVHESVSEVVPTVVTLQWDVDLADPEDVVVEFGPEFARTVAADLDEDGLFTATLLGLKPATDHDYRLRVLHQGEVLRSDTHTVTTGPAPQDLPEISVAWLQPDEARGGYFATQLISVPSAAVILDADGDYVWWYRGDGEGGPLVHRVLQSNTGREMLFQGSVPGNGIDGSPLLEIQRTSMDGEQTRYLSHNPDDHHDFVELPDGTLAVLRSDYLEVDGQFVCGDRITEIRTDGTELEVWSLWDHVAYDPDFPTDPEIGWSHANAIDHDPIEDVYYVSICRFGSIFKIDRSSGEVLWRFGGLDSDFSRPDGSTDLLDEQHQFDVVGDEILVFDNRPDQHVGSRVVRFALDHEAGTATELWEYQTDPPLTCYALGDVQQLDTGHVLVTWSTSGQVDELDERGELVRRLSVELGGGIGYLEYIDSLDDL